MFNNSISVEDYLLNNNLDQIRNKRKSIEEDS